MKTAAAKIDLHKLNAKEYAASRRPSLIDAKPAAYLAYSGQGKPGTDPFTRGIGALYAAAFTIKMTRKFAGRGDYVICKLEAQYFFDADAAPGATPPEQWRWRLLIRTPEFIKPTDLADAVATLRKRGKTDAAADVKLETLTEGPCVQMLHVGPYDREPETIQIMREFAAAKGLALRGPHHEIYLSDPRRVAPERLRTILRIPVTPA